MVWELRENALMMGVNTTENGPKVMTKRFFSSRDYLTVVALWVVAELLLFGKFGFYFQMEAEKYISEANFVLQNQHLSQGRYLFY